MDKPTLSYHHRGGAQPLLGVTIGDRFRYVASQFADHEAIVSVPQQQRLTYREVGALVDRLAVGLSGLGFTRGDRIGVWSTNNVEWVLLQLATARIGVVLVNVNPGYRSSELAYALERSEVQGLFCIPGFRSNDYVASLLELIPELKTSPPDRLVSRKFPLLHRVVIYDPCATMETKAPYKGFTTWSQVLAAGNRQSCDSLEEISGQLDIDDAINIQYTSGTTGSPKAVVLTHHNILNNAYFTAACMGFTEVDRLAVAVPFYHCFGMVLANLLCVSVGACVVIPCEHFEPGAVLAAISQEECTAVHGVPTMFIAELDHPQFDTYNLSSLRTGIMAGAPCPPELLQRVMQDMHCDELLIGYGQTEASPLTHLTSKQDSAQRRVTTVGRNLPHQEVKVVDVETGQTLPVGQIGEICFRGYHVMLGYYKDTKATAGAIDEHGWLASGDLGKMDAEGYIKVTGRLKEMIIRGGENIYPREIEDALYACEAVTEAAVFGVPDELYGEEVVAWIQLHPHSEADEEEIRAYLKPRLAHFKIPKHIRFVDTFPMTVTGKLQKFRMREIEMSELCSDAI